MKPQSTYFLLLAIIVCNVHHWTGGQRCTARRQCATNDQLGPCQSD